MPTSKRHSPKRKRNRSPDVAPRTRIVTSQYPTRCLLSAGPVFPFVRVYARNCEANGGKASGEPVSEHQLSREYLSVSGVCLCVGVCVCVCVCAMELYLSRYSVRLTTGVRFALRQSAPSDAVTRGYARYDGSRSAN